MEKFIADLPIRILVINPEFNERGEWKCDGQSNVICAQMATGQPVLTIFSDNDSADRYLKKAGVDARVVLLETGKAAAAFARNMKGLHGISQVTFDPTLSESERSARLIAVDEFISKCESFEDA